MSVVQHWMAGPEHYETALGLLAEAAELRDQVWPEHPQWQRHREQFRGCPVHTPIDQYKALVADWERDQQRARDLTAAAVHAQLAEVAAAVMMSTAGPGAGQHRDETHWEHVTRHADGSDHPSRR
jgi:hypothetical protein